MSATNANSLESGQFIDWLQRNEFKVIVWDMDCTMSAGHCGPGLTLDQLDEYVNGVSCDFVSAMQAISKANTHQGCSFRCAVATGSDPYEYDLPGQSRATHILGPDLATKLITKHCPETLHLFELMVGYDCRLHLSEQEKDVNYEGKREHMRRIQKHYNVPFENMVLIDDSASSLVNEDGWVGIRVLGKEGFKFIHCVNADGGTNK